jgi:hypothetical protein
LCFFHFSIWSIFFWVIFCCIQAGKNPPSFPQAAPVAASGAGSLAQPLGAATPAIPGNGKSWENHRKVWKITFKWSCLDVFFTGSASQNAGCSMGFSLLPCLPEGKQ